MTIDGHSLDDVANRAAAIFSERFGRRPRWLAAAPGRVNLIGEHTDYNGGHVLPMAIERWTVLAADLPDPESQVVRLLSADLHQETVFTAAPEVSRGEPAWANYVRGVVAGLLGLGAAVPGFDAVIASSVPLGGGLSSSAALEVATATLLEALAGHSLAPAEKAALCQRAEHEFAGVPCGIMDQFIAVGGQADHLMLLDCRSVAYEMIPFADPDVTVLIVNSQVRHSLAAGEYAVRREECFRSAKALGVSHLCDATLCQLDERRSTLQPMDYRRARHIVGENQRVLDVAKAIAARDWATVGAAMYASHQSLANDYAVSCDELDLLVDLAKSIGPSGGVIGSRMTGGGFGGCTVSLVRTENSLEIAEKIARGYREQTGVAATFFTTRPAAGARLCALG